jgi:SAM-dependent methyltransferase
LTKFYQAEYRALYSGDESPTKEDLTVQQARAGHLAGVAKSQVREVRSHLDIGCSAGELLSAVRAAYSGVANFRSVGIEPSCAHRTWCAQKGLLVYPAIHNLLAAGESEFDLVTISHVLEHLVDPVTFLRDLRLKALSSAGFLLLEVPNLFGHGCFEIAHTLAFCERTLKEMLRVSGFSLILTKLHSIPFESSSHFKYITVLAAPAGCANGSQLEARRIWWRIVKWRRTQWSLGLGSCWSHFSVRLPNKATRFLYRRLRRQE